MRGGLWVSVRLMNRALISATLALVAACWAASPAFAQQAAPGAEAGAPPSMVTTPKQSTSEVDWWQVDLAEAKERSRRTRNALIGTSAAFAAGVIMGGVGGSQCQVVPSSTGSSQDELLCNNAGSVLLPLGATIGFLGFVGMLTSGIMLGVSNKRKREIQRDIRRSQYGRRLQLDPASGGLIF